METGTNAAEDAAEDVAEEQTEEPVEEQSGQPAEEQEEPAAEDEDEGGPAGTRNGSIESPADESISDGDMDEDIWEDAVQEEIPVPEELEQSEAMYSEADAAGGDSAEIGSWAELKQMINECEVSGSITQERETVRESAAATMVTAARSPSTVVRSKPTAATARAAATTATAVISPSTAAPSSPPKSTRGRVRASAAAATLLPARSP